jgi:hypothetical protein
VGAGQLPGDRQAETSTAGIARPGLVEADKALEDPLPVPFRDRRAVVADLTSNAKREDLVDAKTGTVPANRVEDDDSDDVAEYRRLLDSAKVDHAAAIQAASAEVPQGRVVDLDLDEDDGSVEWDVEIIAPARPSTR